MRRLLLAATLAATAASFAPAAHADPTLCVRTLNDKGAEQTTCVPYLETFGYMYCTLVTLPPPGSQVTYHELEVCLRTVV